MSSFLVDILTPSSVLGKDIKAESLLIPTVGGQINVLPGHTHIISNLDNGILAIYGEDESQTKFFNVTGGVCKVLEDRVQILSTAAEEKTSIDVERAKEALKNALEKLGDEDLDCELLEKYFSKCSRANNRIKCGSGDLSEFNKKI